jgi:two-component system, chemotaxis family, sensor kinase CheA
MDVGRFLDLYVSETQDHVRLLQRSLLRLDADRDGHALTEAFRAVHTLKGMSAAMGHGRVAALAHELEDRLDELRGRTPASAEDVDAMLLRADELERAIAAAIDGNSVLDESDLLRPARSAQHAAPTGPAERPIEADLPAVDAHVARVVLCEDAPLKAARALLIVRALDGMPGVLGTYPDHFDTDFAGTLDIYLDDTFDAAAIEVAVTAVGDVDRVRFIDRAGTPRAGAGAAHQTARLPQLRVNSERLDGLADGIGELSVLFGRLARDGAEPVLAGSLAATVDRMAVVIHELQHDVLELRMVRVREAFERLPRVVRDASRALGKEVDLVLTGDDVEMDRTILEEIGEPLVHLLRNAVDHGIEPPEERTAIGKPARGRIDVEAARERSSVRIVVSDDGRGIDAAAVVEHARRIGLLAPTAEIDLTSEEVLRLVSQAGFSTAGTVSTVSGRGVGMDVVVSRIRALGGAIDMQTVHGAGTTFNIRLPITLALVHALRVRVGDDEFAVPLTHIGEVVELAGTVAIASAGETVQVRGETMPLVRLRRVLRLEGDDDEHAAIVAESGGRRAALAVDGLVGREQILVKSFDAAAGMLPYFSGAALLGDGQPVLVLDPLSVI